MTNHAQVETAPQCAEIVGGVCTGEDWRAFPEPAVCCVVGTAHDVEVYSRGCTDLRGVLYVERANPRRYVGRVDLGESQPVPATLEFLQTVAWLELRVAEPNAAPLEQKNERKGRANLRPEIPVPAEIRALDLVPIRRMPEPARAPNVAGAAKEVLP